jgi:lipopolysaccharide export system permease protein
MRIVRPLDRYVFTEFLRIFLVSSLGFPFLVVLFDLVDNLNKYLDRGLTRGAIALSYVYYVPESMFYVLPAAVLFATVFTIGSATRHSEIAAAKASGISFRRFILPLFFGALFAGGLDLALGEAVPKANRRRAELLKENTYRVGTYRNNFTYVGDEGRVYKISLLRVDSGIVSGIEIVRKGTGADYPTYVLSAGQGRYRDSTGWVFGQGTLHIIADSTRDVVMQFGGLADHRLKEPPSQLAVSEKAPEEMNFRELGRFIRAMERSGSNVGKFRVDRMLKIAIPATCVIILLFGAPLATTTERGGAMYGIGISLGTTMLFLMMTQLTKAIGGNGLVPPELAAWLPSILFGTIGLVLLIRVRT